MTKFRTTTFYPQVETDFTKANVWISFKSKADLSLNLDSFSRLFQPFVEGHEQLREWIGEWVNEWVNEWTNEYTFNLSLSPDSFSLWLMACRISFSFSFLSASRWAAVAIFWATFVSPAFFCLLLFLFLFLSSFTFVFGSPFVFGFCFSSSVLVLFSFSSLFSFLFFYFDLWLTFVISTQWVIPFQKADPVDNVLLIN